MPRTSNKTTRANGRTKTGVSVTIPKPTTIDHPLRVRRQLAVAAGCSVPTLDGFLVGAQPAQERTAAAHAYLVDNGYIAAQGAS